MNKLILIAALAVGMYQLLQWYQSSRPMPEMSAPYVVVYGRDSCGYTSKLRRYLTERGVPFHYRVVDEKPVADDLHARMNRAGISTRRYNLPVVDVSGVLSIRPEPVSVVRDFSG